MSRLMKKRTYPEYEKEYISELRCDICGRKAPNPGEYYPWQKDMYDAMEVEVHLREGSQYPEGGSGEDTSFDICPKCFKEKLVPALFALGAVPRITDWDD